MNICLKFIIILFTGYYHIFEEKFKVVVQQGIGFPIVDNDVPSLELF